ncbi:hypothetical protein HK405_007340 [Cladochytrium tenue]|nr:hypothetical protein HK405_007340 [Cladochytrium tenue]
MESSTVTVAVAAVTTVAVAATTLVVAFWDDPVFHWPRIPPPSKLQAFTFRRPPMRIPILGDALQVIRNRDRMHDFVAEVTQQCIEEERATGVLVINCVKMPFSPPIVTTADPKIVEHILKTHFHVYDKGPFFFSRTSDVLGHGIFAVDGDQWRAQRKSAALIFNVRNFREYVSVVFAEEVDHLLARLGRAADNGEVVDLHELFFKFTLDGFCRIGFGEHLGSLSSEKPLPFATAFDDAQTRIVRRFNTPLWWLFEYLTLGAFKQYHNTQIIKSFGQAIVRKRMATISKSATGFIAEERDDLKKDDTAHAAISAAATDRPDLLQFLMQSVDPLTGRQPTSDSLVDYVINFIIAGRDTTAQALSWCFLMLHRNPVARQELQAEIDATFPAERDGDHATYEEVRGLKYANAVFHETLRLYPSVPVEIKQANQSDTLPNGVVVPKGALVSWAPYAMGRSTQIWGDDAAEFRPARWLDPASWSPSAYEYPVFNAGPRTCLGKNMAEVEGVFAMVEILRCFDFTVVNHEKVTYGFSLTLPMKGGMHVQLKRRERKPSV